MIGSSLARWALTGAAVLAIAACGSVATPAATRSAKASIVMTATKTVSGWEATTFDVRPDQQLALARRAADMGVELFVIDDGWFGQRDHDRLYRRLCGQLAPAGGAHR